MKSILAKRAVLERLRSATAPTNYFLELAPPWKEAKLVKLETEAGIRFPEDYRAFLTTVGVGGAPDGYNGLAKPTCGGPGRINEPFPLVEPIRGDVEVRGEDDGSLAIAAMGCGVCALLVVTGTERGCVWVDCRASDGVFARAATSFTEWYEAYLDEAVRGRGLDWASAGLE